MGLVRPEITRYRKRLSQRYTSPENSRTLLLVPQTRNKPFHKAPEFKKIRQLLRLLGPEKSSQIHVCVYAAPFGVIPLELDEVYPLSQHEIALPLDLETINYVADQVADFIKSNSYQSITLLNDSKLWQDTIKKICKQVCDSKGLTFNCVETNLVSNKDLVLNLEEILSK